MNAPKVSAGAQAHDDPMARAEELARWAPADIKQWLDDLVDDPHVSDAQYLNAATAAHTALVGDLEPDGFDQDDFDQDDFDELSGTLADSHDLDDDTAAQVTDLSTQDLVDRALAHLDAANAAATGQCESTERERGAQLNRWNTEANSATSEDGSCNEY